MSDEVIEMIIIEQDTSMEMVFTITPAFMMIFSGEPLVKAGQNGISAYGYVAFAFDALGNGFSMTPGRTLDFIAFKFSAVEIADPQADDFAGLWHQYKGGDIEMEKVTFINTIATGQYADMQPPEGREWEIQNFAAAGGYELYKTDGVNTILVDSDSNNAAARFGWRLVCTSGIYYRLKNTNAAPKVLTYEGVVTK